MPPDVWAAFLCFTPEGRRDNCCYLGNSSTENCWGSRNLDVRHPVNRVLALTFTLPILTFLTRVIFRLFFPTELFEVSYSLRQCKTSGRMPKPHVGIFWLLNGKPLIDSASLRARATGNVMVG